LDVLAEIEAKLDNRSALIVCLKLFWCSISKMWLCGGSVAQSVRHKAPATNASSLSASNEDERTPTEYPTTGGLQIVMRNDFLRQAFRSFVKTTWNPVFSADTSAAFRNNARSWALNCIDFLTDVRDFSLLRHNSVFQSYRALHIFEKYIAHGAVLQVGALFSPSCLRLAYYHSPTPHSPLPTPCNSLPIPRAPRAHAGALLRQRDRRLLRRAVLRE